MLNEKDYCDYDTCMYLIDFGYFDPDPIDWYVDDYDHIAKITLYEAQKWLREKEDVIIVVCPYTYDIIDKTHTWTCEIWFGDNLEYEIHDFKSYEEALSEGIREVIKILKEE